MRVIKLVGGLVLLLMVVVVIFSRKEISSQEVCISSGGRWVALPAVPPGSLVNDGGCYYPPKDEGKACYQSSECEKECVSTRNTDDEGYILGKCGEYSMFECVPVIPIKTKDRKQLKGGSCA